MTLSWPTSIVFTIRDVQHCAAISATAELLFMYSWREADSRQWYTNTVRNRSGFRLPCTCCEKRSASSGNFWYVNLTRSRTCWYPDSEPVKWRFGRRRRLVSLECRHRWSLCSAPWRHCWQTGAAAMSCLHWTLSITVVNIAIGKTTCFSCTTTR